MAADHKIKERKTMRNGKVFEESYVSGVHVHISTLKQLSRCPIGLKNVAGPNEDGFTPGIVPHYPRPVEFHVSKIAHVTTKPGLDGILDCDGFQGGEKTGFLWWGLVIDSKEISMAEKRYLETLFPGRSKEEKNNQEPFLNHFTSSLVFKDASRYGNFRFSFSLTCVLSAYSTQCCGGQTPVLRIYKTVMYKKIMYVVLIHSPDVQNYNRYPELGDNDDGVCAYRDGEIIWRAQAISGTHRCKMIKNTIDKIVTVQCGVESDFEYYVWDHVTLAFHIEESLTFIPEELLAALSPCGNGDIALNPLIGIDEAKRIVDDLKAKGHTAASGEQ